MPNPSFEDTVSCPTLFNQINHSSGWSAYRETPDYFNSCNNDFYSVPSNIAGFQNARTGNAYAGIVTLNIAVNALNESIGIQLIQTLVIGQKYFVSFYVSRGISNHNDLAARYPLKKCVSRKVILKNFLTSFKKVKKNFSEITFHH